MVLSWVITQVEDKLFFEFSKDTLSVLQVNDDWFIARITENIDRVVTGRWRNVNLAHSSV